ncbi:MAG: dockerin type I repeat-containing protein [Ruminococcus sp.]|uniref:dockerin type I repeat-containing protein n=1 Tax=Ruminococcus sp. TaxID=41978 RepID=UPI0025EB6472|nr:dockerin type I repeat-containing protein [Ruminococcus sp.]MCR4794986.1 dockerin type I repeat-containing protein [Ruminococcus sp.]
MKQLLKSLSALTASAAITVCSMTSGLTYVVGADEKTCTVHYDLSEEGVSIPADEEGNVPELKDITVSANSSIQLTDIIPEREGYSFSGWTADNIRGYESLDIFRVLDEDVTLKPVWVEKNDKEFHTVHYKVIIDGVEDEDAKLRVPDKKLITGRIFKISLEVFTNPGYKQRGWTDGVNEFLPETKLIVHDEDITLYPNYKKLYNLIYTVGDADRINGVSSLEFEIAEGDSTNIQSTSRFSRNGFKTSKWHCETDGKDYNGDAYFEMPGSDVIMTPVWEPIRYVVVFKQNSNSSDNIKVSGYTDTAIIAPECKITKENEKFSGWQRGDLIIQPGEEYVIPGAEPGMGIAFTALWSPDNGGETTTTTSSATTSVTSTTTTTVTSKASTSSSTTTSATTTATSTTSVPTTTVSTEYAPYSHVVNVYDKETKERVNDAALLGSWYISYIINGVETFTAPLERMDLSEKNPVVLSYNKYKDAKTCRFSISGVSHDSPYIFSEDDYTVKTDETNHITYHNVYLTKRELTYGDANCDGTIDMSDVVLIMQALANPNKYDVNGSDLNCITALGRKNADVWNTGDGVTTQDALHIQKYLLGLCDITAKVEMVE